MKALVVLDDKDKIESLKKRLSEIGYDTICYQWLMKALDNIEEIAPHLVIINAEDYPRHWKIFVQHLKAHSFGYETKIYLIANNLTEDELDKIQILGIQDVIYDIENDFYKISNNEKIENELEIKTDSNQDETTETTETTEKSFINDNTQNEVENLNQNKIIDEEKQTITSESDKTEKSTEIKLPENNPTIKLNETIPPKKKVVSSCTFSLLNPNTNKVILGKVRRYKYPTIIFYPNNKSEIQNLRFGQIFENCTLKQVVDNNELSSSHRCQIRGKTEDYIEFCLLR